MLNNPCLKKADIVIADRDWQMADVLRSVLRDLGFSGVSVARNGRRAVEILKERPIDMLITEWEMDGLDGIHLIKTLRRSENPYFALMPIIMLTGHAAAEDVMLARDMGVTEFLVKPYTTKTLYRHLEHIIDYPRDFIVSERFTGPDRRRLRLQATAERRRREPVLSPHQPRIVRMKDQAIRLASRRRIRRKTGLNDALRDIITPEVLAEAQSTINALQETSLQWIAEDMQVLESAVAALGATEPPPQALEDAISHVLSIKSRAGTFGYWLASRIAYNLYNFLREDFVAGNPQHQLVLNKYLETLRAFLARKVVGEGQEIEQRVLQGLDTLHKALVH